jgi:hypothetical protein
VLTHSSGLARGWHAVFVACPLALAGCNPHVYDEMPALHDTKRAEVSGSWIGYGRTNVVFRPDGRADIRLAPAAWPAPFSMCAARSVRPIR